MIAFAAIKGWTLHELYVNNTFYHGEIDEEVFLRPPPGYLQEGEKRVYQLNKSLYGLKQASRNWFAKLKGVLIEFRFIQTKSDYPLFF